jgi:TonB family protein
LERAKLFLKDGKTIEGPRVSETVALYDPNGKRIDPAASPKERSASAGKVECRYDERGNIIESTLRSDNGSLISKEMFKYEFDELGNWKSMIKSIAVYENGSISYEPIEVAYRTITYYFDQSVARLAADSKGLKSSSSLMAHAESAKPEQEPVDGNAPVTTESNGPESSNGARSNHVESNESNLEDPSTTRSVIHLSEDALRKSLVELPEGEYPVEAKMANIEGKVEVQVIINERGEVTTAKAISGNPLLTEAATRAVSKARFSPKKLSSQSSHVFGLITYEFSLRQKRIGVLEPAETEKLVTSAARTNLYRDTAVVKPVESRATDAGTTSSRFALPTTASPESTPSVSTEPNPTISGTPFEKGMASLNAANFEAAIQFFKEIIQRDPEDAEAYYKLGFAYSSLDKHHETISAYKKAIRLKRTLATADSFYRLGTAYLALGDHLTAIEPLKQAVYVIRAQVLESDPQKANMGGPTEAEAHYALGLSYYGSGSSRQATSEFQNALRLKPDFAPAYYGLGLSLLATGDKRAAEKQEAALRKMKSPLADKLAGALLTPAVQKNRVF